MIAIPDWTLSAAAEAKCMRGGGRHRFRVEGFRDRV